MQSVANHRNTVLVVDDEPTIITMARLALEPKGYTVIGACNGTEALELYAQRNEDLALAILDYMLPDILGDELLERMSAINESVRFIAASGCSDDEIAPSFLVGTEAFLRKPFSVKELAERIDGIVLAPTG